MSKSIMGTISILILCASAASAQAGCITGLVLDESGRPRENMQVEARKPGFNWSHTQARTDANGRFQILGVPPDQYEIVADQGTTFYYGKPEPHVTVTDSEKCEGVVIRLGPDTATLNLSVLDAITKRPIDLPTFEFRRPDQSGLWTQLKGHEVRVPSLVELKLKLQAVGYEKSQVKLPSFYPGEVRGLSIELQPAKKGCIAGNVTGEDNFPVAGAQVKPMIANRGSINEDHSVVTDSQGRFQVNDLEVGPYHVYAAKWSDGYLGTQNDVEISLSSPFPCIEVALKIGLKGARLRVTAVDAKTRKQIPQVQIVVSDQPGKPIYSSLREWLPEHVMLLQPLRDLGLSIYVDGYEEGKMVHTGLLAPGERKDLTVELQPAGGFSAPNPQ